MTDARRLVRNRAQCDECGDIVESKSRHDWRRCTCGNLFVDGGLDYERRGWKGSSDGKPSYTELSEYA